VIINLLVTLLLTIAHTIGALIPNLPDVPTAMADVADGIAAFVAGSLGRNGMLFTPALVIAVAFVTITIISWTTIYGSIRWVWNKIPFLNQIKL